MAIQTNTEILAETLHDVDELIEYMLSESGDPNPPRWLLELKTKLAVVYGRLKDSEGEN
jgi:hypothetical protein